MFRVSSKTVGPTETEPNRYRKKEDEENPTCSCLEGDNKREMNGKERVLG